MKYKVNFAYGFGDVVNPKRFKKQVQIATPLEFPFPKQVEDEIIALKKTDPARYADKKVEQFESYTGVAPAKFQSGFETAVKKEIDANFVDYLKKAAKPDFTEEQWVQVLGLFEARQVEYVKTRFAKLLGDIVTINYEKLKKLRATAPKPDEVRTLAAEEAFMLWCGRSPVKFSQVEDKFYDDHVSEVRGEALAFADAVGRYKKNKNKMSSWVEVDSAKLLNKANNGKVYPTLHRGGQQVAVQVTCDTTTVTLEENTPAGEKKIKQFKSENKHWAQVGDVYLSATFTKGTKSFYVVGEWNPETGDAKLYHYQADRPNLGLAAKYLKWTYSHREGKFTSPAV